LAFSSIQILYTPIFGTESPAIMLFLWPCDKVGTYLAVIIFLGATFLNLALPANFPVLCAEIGVC